MASWDLIKHLERQRAWSLETFGPGLRTEGVSDHIRKELLEIAEQPTNLLEWTDVILLALDGAWRAGHDPVAIAGAINYKQGKNESRTWPDWRTADPNKAIEHDRMSDPKDPCGECGSNIGWGRNHYPNCSQAGSPSRPEVRRYLFDARAGTLSRYEDGTKMILSADGEVVPGADYDAKAAECSDYRGRLATVCEDMIVAQKRIDELEAAALVAPGGGTLSPAVCRATAKFWEGLAKRAEAATQDREGEHEPR